MIGEPIMRARLRQRLEQRGIESPAEHRIEPFGRSDRRQARFRGNGHAAPIGSRHAAHPGFGFKIHADRRANLN
jgi:hypothetical protein